MESHITQFSADLETILDVDAAARAAAEDFLSEKMASAAISN
jgi:hypothetical protein